MGQSVVRENPYKIKSAAGDIGAVAPVAAFKGRVHGCTRPLTEMSDFRGNADMAVL